MEKIFEINNENYTDKNPLGVDKDQLSFDDYQASEKAAVVSSKIPYIDYLLINGREFYFPRNRYFVLSIAIHAALIATLLYYVINEALLKPVEIQREFISITVEGPSSNVSPQFAPPAEPAPPVIPKVKPEKNNSAPNVSAKHTVKKSFAVKSTPIKSKSHNTFKPRPVFAKTYPQANTKAASTPIQTFPETINDIAIPDLAEVKDADLDDSKNAPSLAEIKNQLDDIDEGDNQKLIAANKDMNQLSKEQLASVAEQSEELANQNSEIDHLAESRKAELAAEKNRLSAIQATQNKKGKKGSFGAGKESDPVGSEIASASSSQGNGHGNKGSGEGPIAVRKLEDLRQMPGNKKPEYDVNDRLNGLSGSIIVNAYVTQDGKLTNFKIVQSTGFRNLDRKSILALRNWKFYPGQEGWVELPFKWDLKGGVQQKPTLLKRR